MQWARRKASGAPSEADGNPTAALRCQHGGLLPEQAPGAKRQLIPERVWDYFHDNAGRVEGADSSGYSPFREDVETCTVCRSEIEKTTSNRESLRYCPLWFLLSSVRASLLPPSLFLLWTYCFSLKDI
jgi:ubiquitin carboxyl-terminal hydrolase 48